MIYLEALYEEIRIPEEIFKISEANNFLSNNKNRALVPCFFFSNITIYTLKSSELRITWVEGVLGVCLSSAVIKILMGV